MRIFLAILAALLLVGTAHAQTTTTPVMATKAPPIPGYPSKCGFYFGVNALGGGSTVADAPVPGTTEIAGDVGGLVGYACSISSIPYFIEGIFDWQNLNATAPGFSLTGPAHIEQRVGVQTPLLQFLPVLGFPSTGTVGSLPVLPPGVTVNGAAQNYMYGAVNEDDISGQVGLTTARAWLISAEVGTGMLVPLKLANGWNAVADVWAGAKLQSDSLCIGTMACPKLGTGFQTGVAFKF